MLLFCDEFSSYFTKTSTILLNIYNKSTRSIDLYNFKVMRKFSHPFIAELKRHVATQNSTLGPIILSLCDLIKSNESSPEKQNLVKSNQIKLSQVTDMIHAAHVFHRCVRNHPNCDNTNVTEESNFIDATSKRLHQDNVLSVLVGDYLLAQSSVDMADLRFPRTVGLIAKGLEDFTRGEFLKLQLLDRCEKDKSKVNTASIRDGIKYYAELTCGSLLSNACLSAALLAGYSNAKWTKNGTMKSESEDNISEMVFRFGFHTGSAHRLIEFLHCPDNNSESEKAFMEVLDVKYFDDSISNHLDLAMDVLAKLPHGSKKSTLVSTLKEMRNRSCSTVMDY